MTRPAAILWFERLWLASTLAWLAGAALSWDERRRLIAGNPALAGYEWLVPAGFGLVLAISLALWWLTARRASRAARGGVAAVALLSALVLGMTLVGLVSGRALALAATMLQLVSSGLGIAGAVMLFREGAREWFGDSAPAQVAP